MLLALRISRAIFVSGIDSSPSDLNDEVNIFINRSDAIENTETCSEYIIMRCGRLPEASAVSDMEHACRCRHVDRGRIFNTACQPGLVTPCGLFR